MENEKVPFELETMSCALNYRREVLRLFEPYLGRNLLEVGGGYGFFSEALLARPATESLYVIEPDPFCRAAIETRCKGLHLLSGTAFDFTPGRRFDSVISINVLEHIADDLPEISRYRELLTDDGVLCLFTPARHELFSPMDVRFGHHRRYNREELRQLLERAGYQVEQLHYFNFAGYFLWWASFVLMKQKTFNPKLVRFNDRFIFPATRFVERCFGNPPIGQSLFAVVRKTTHQPKFSA